ncbi:MAG: alanine acetyltransferase [Hymenobacter sp.]|jgi:ribosomal-protein-alanine N-acetyltransferase|nr:alanine acetyltransferase [Hymenobacter sp.]
MLSISCLPFPTLRTERLTLRQLTPADAAAMFVLRRDPRVMQYIPRPLAQTVAEAEEYISRTNELMGQNQLVNWGITLGPDSPVIGTIGFFGFKFEHYRAEVGYLLGPEWQGQGLMHEALRAVLRYGFLELNLHSVEGIIAPQNAASSRVLERAGFIRDGYFRESEFYDGKFVDIAHYSLLAPAAEPSR